jgi:hypothetical protein
MSGISNADFENISLQVKSHLLKGPCEPKVLVGLCNGNEQSILKVTRWLLDQQIIAMNVSGMLELKN